MKTLVVMSLLLFASSALAQTSSGFKPGLQEQVRRLKENRLVDKAKQDHALWRAEKFGDIRIPKNAQAYKKYMAEQDRKRKQQQYLNKHPSAAKSKSKATK